MKRAEPLSRILTYSRLFPSKMELLGMSDALSSFKVACASRSQLNGQLMRAQRSASLVTRATASHELLKAVSAAPGRHAIRNFENGLKDGKFASEQKSTAYLNQKSGIRPVKVNTGSNQKIRVAVDVDEGKQQRNILKALLNCDN